MNDSVVCYSTISDTPKEIWASNVGFGYEHAPSMQMEKDFIMIHTGTGWYSNTREYFNSPFITPAAAERIIRLRPVAVGVNGPTVDDRRGEGRPIHRAFLSHGVHIIEGIVRSELLAGKRFHCTALPLKLAGFTGSPIRFVAVLEEPA